MSYRWVWAVPLGFSLLGCGAVSGPPAAAGDVVRAAAAATRIEVSADPAALRRARELGARRQREDRAEELDTLIMMADVDAESFAALRKRRAGVVPVLRKQLEGPAGSRNSQRTAAAFMLLRLGDPAGIDAARKALTVPGESFAVLGAAAELGPADRAKLPGLEGVVLRSLDSRDRELRRVAVEAAGRLASPAMNRRLLELIRKGDETGGRAAFWLSQAAPSEELIRLSAARLRSTDQQESYWYLTGLAEAAAAKSPAVSAAAVEACAQALTRRRDDGLGGGTSGGEASALEAVAEHGGAKAAELLERLARASTTPDPLRARALEALARRDPPRGRALALSLLSIPELRSAAISTLGTAGRGSGDAELVRVLRETAARSQDGDGVAPAAASALLLIGGDAAIRAAAALADRLDPADRAAVRWAEHGITAEKALQRLGELKVLDEKALARARAKLAAALKQEPADRLTDDGIYEYSQAGREADDPTGAKRFLGATFEAAGLLTSFDAETGVIPVRHDRLLRDFARHSGGAFKPEAPYERWLGSDDDEEAPYVVQFIHGGKLYKFKAENLGDWYDVTAVVDAANRALADAGERRRFVALVGDGQVAELVFADPEALAAAAKELFLPLGDDPNAAVDSGKEFEDEVIERIRSSGEVR
ncbi:MAG: hypothetical protein ACK47B_04600 [Armatimonadota bacterium]